MIFVAPARPQPAGTSLFLEIIMALKKVKIEIESLIEELDDNGLTADSDKTHSTADGVMRISEGEARITYSETDENGKTDSEILLLGKTVSVKRTGALKYEFVFREGEGTSAVYTVTPYSFDAEIYTRRIKSSLSESGGEVTLIYDMTLGGAKKKTKMTIRVSEK